MGPLSNYQYCVSKLGSPGGVTQKDKKKNINFPGNKTQILPCPLCTSSIKICLKSVV